ncbi:MAG: MBL fold metallo-hydrolase [candidate division KSB1 bacterium]|nr:MBL fold metallo-hydrolase [candidate division KSB1 bacterium]
MKRFLFFLGLPFLLYGQILKIHTHDGAVHEYRIAEIDSITFGSRAGTLKWLGHASVKIKTNEGVVIYIDPFAGTDYGEPADLILVTHGHNDHNQVQKVAKKADCRIIAGPGANVVGVKMSVGDSTEVKGVKIRAVEAYNNNHPRGSGVGFILEINGLKLYHAGDTGKIPEMAALAALHLDYALLPIDGVYNMSPAEAMAASELIGAKRAIPIHVAPSNASQAEKQKNIDKFTPPNRLILKEGDTIYL